MATVYDICFIIEVYIHGHHSQHSPIRPRLVPSKRGKGTGWKGRLWLSACEITNSSPCWLPWIPLIVHIVQINHSRFPSVVQLHRKWRTVAHEITCLHSQLTEQLTRCPWTHHLTGCPWTHISLLSAPDHRTVHWVKNSQRCSVLSPSADFRQPDEVTGDLTRDSHIRHSWAHTFKLY